MKESIGLMEVRGMLKAIIVADIALKVANVKLVAMERVTAGLVCVIIQGDVSAVSVAIESVVASVDCDTMISKHVIAHPDVQTMELLESVSNKNNAPVEELVLSSDLHHKQELELASDTLISQSDAVMDDTTKKHSSKSNKKKNER